LLADPARHPLIDGSGMLREWSGGVISGVGDVFTMKMHNAEMGDYEMANLVAEFEPGRRIGWEPILKTASRPEDQAEIGDDRSQPHSWSFELAPLGATSTLVTETYDCSRAPEWLRKAVKGGTRWVPDMTATLEKLDALDRAGTAESLSITTADGRVLSALVSGPADGTVLVLHTGTPAGLVPLPAGLDPAPLGIRTVMYARPGYSGSTPQAGRAVADAVADVTALLDALGAAEFLNVGYSGGGPYALACDALLPGRCLATAVIAGPAPYAQAEPASPVRAWFEADDDTRLALAGDVERFRRAVDGFVVSCANVTAEGIASDAAGGPDGDPGGELPVPGYAEWIASSLRAASASGSQGTADDCLASLRDWGFPLARVRPVTLWHGAGDQNVPRAHADWLRDHLPQADLRVLAGEGHPSIIGRLPEILAALTAAARPVPR
jgi:pimeloyl-ACP methyl ester carboxylesterase